jgi:hypothetical protein
MKIKYKKYNKLTIITKKNSNLPCHNPYGEGYEKIGYKKDRPLKKIIF